jgi:AbrB family looped-hinge helix DNA binding protein
MIKKVLKGIAWFFGTLLGIPSVIDQPPPQTRRRRFMSDNVLRVRTVADPPLSIDEITHSELRFRVVVSEHNRITLPSDLAKALNVNEGDVLIVEVARDHAVLRPVRVSHAGEYSGAYGSGYLENERKSWG